MTEPTMPQAATRSPRPGRRVVLTTLGSLGDLHPYIAIAHALQARGHRAVIATGDYHREAIESQGIGFHPVRPDFSQHLDDPEFYRKAMDRKTGTSFVVQEIVVPHLRAAFEDTFEAARGADLLVTHPLTFTGPMVVEMTGIPWVSTQLAPISMLSRYDPPLPPQATWLRPFLGLGPAFWGPAFWLVRPSFRRWTDPMRALRADLGLPPGPDPLFGGMDSPSCVLALFSKVLGAPQPDWPPQAVQTGFAFFDRKDGRGLDPELSRFLDAGEPPVVFTLGSSAVMDAGRFYEESVAAARRLGRRAVLLIGEIAADRNRPRDPLPDGIVAFAYAPYSELFPRAAAIVHQGGVGTTGQALRSGRPMLVVPWGHDQPDNAHRVARLGVARTIPRHRYSASTTSEALRRLLDDPSYATRADEVGRLVRSEDGASAACDAIEMHLAIPRPATGPGTADR